VREVGSLGGAPPLPPPLPRGEAPVPGLRLGEVVEAQLLETLSQREGILSIGGRVFRALHPEGLNPGQRLQLRLVSLGPPPLFKLPAAADEGVARLLLPPAQGVTAAVRALLAAPAGEEAGDPLLASLRQLLRVPAEPEALASALARLVRGSGLHHEARLAAGEDPADLKSLALKLLATKPEGALARAAEALLGHVEAHQARSVLEGVLVLPLVLPWGEEWVQGEIRLEDGEGRGAGEAAGGSLRLRLQMPRLGPVEVRLRWGAGGVSVRLALDPAALEEARGQLPELSRRLSAEAGVRVADLRAEALPPPAPKSGPGLVEVVA